MIAVTVWSGSGKKNQILGLTGDLIPCLLGEKYCIQPLQLGTYLFFVLLHLSGTSQNDATGDLQHLSRTSERLTRLPYLMEGRVRSCELNSRILLSTLVSVFWTDCRVTCHSGPKLSVVPAVRRWLLVLQQLLESLPSH